MARKNTLFFLLGLILLAMAVWQIYSAGQGLKITSLSSTNPPVTVISSANYASATRPTVLIAHGFAGSSVLMRGFALTLAHAGYTTVSWDFQGHARNPNPLELSSGSTQLLQDAERALAEAEAAGLVVSTHVAILGHSMGSGVALSYGLSYSQTSATITISPTGQNVTPTLPRNLLLMAGSLEPQFSHNAENLFLQAGGPNDDFTAGTARQLVIIPNVEHISILFSPTAQKDARSWLDQVFGAQLGATEYTDRRILWFALGIIGSVLIAQALMGVIPSPTQIEGDQRPLWMRLVALLAGGVTATLILWLISLLGVDLSRLLGILVGGYLLIWFGIAGVVSLFILRPRLSRLDKWQLFKSGLAFAALWLGVGFIGNYVWLPWLLIPQRLWLWIPGSLLVIPWFISVGELTRHARVPAQLGWWAFQSVVIILSLFLATILNPALGFIFIILPLVPVMIGLHMLVITARHGTWSYAIPGALFISWLLLAVFPLQ